MSKTETAPKAKRKYTKTNRWNVSGSKTNTDTTGLVEALKVANNLLRDGSEDSVTIARIKRDA